MPEHYREYVEEIAASGDRPSQVILNRSPDHASAVLAALFRHARDHVHIVSCRLSHDVYCSEGLPEAAAAFLRVHHAGAIKILVETAVDRDTHPFLIAVDNVAPHRVQVAVVPELARQQYQYNFAVADGESYRFEENRDVREAMIRFRDVEFGQKLERTFSRLWKFAEQPAV